ncbi:hypothetical protein [Streptomyces halobius]|uniref:Uncharacterized protein n=1 Tax=Streptomyces halobius TaxID=2879846 RepID=A0ABY4MK36_9ACTN|nr:hypothetical protein [Streptomyces halobius]UQA90514.1 hypothetical protein K9S39_00060 [Streptomyces halobius]UQA97562.1 hypothetical protein K9S39_41990 [Streptomyces halobius]
MTEHKAFLDGSNRAEDHDFDPMVQALLDREERRLLASAPPVPDGIDEWHALVAEAGFVRRSSVLARGAPLHRIDQRQAWQRFPRDRYDPRTLALAALEAVVSRQEMEAEATTEEVVEFLASLAASAAPERDASEHLAVARFVLRELLNDAQDGEEFDVSYSDYREGHSRVTLSLRILEEGFGRRGQAVLRATTPAINLLLSGLDHDLEDVQAAKDMMLRRQVDTGRWSRAEESAAESLKLSLMYCERVRAVLEETERDVRAVDWGQDVPKLLQASREHLGERHRVERELMEYMRGVRNDVEDADVRRTCERILQLLGRAHLRHTQLLEKVIDARPAFLRSQAEQRFRPPPRLALVGMQKDVLEPVLCLGVEDAEAVVILFADAAGGPVITHRPRLRDWWASLLAPAREVQETCPDEDIELIADDAGELDMYSEEDVAIARTVLMEALRAPVRLSRLLEQALAHRVEAADLLAVCVLRAFAPDPEEDEEEAMADELADLLGELLVVLDDGAVFDLGTLAGSDLLLVPAQSLIPDPTCAEDDVEVLA